MSKLTNRERFFKGEPFKANFGECRCEKMGDSEVRYITIKNPPHTGCSHFIHFCNIDKTDENGFYWSKNIFGDTVEGYAKFEDLKFNTDGKA